MCENNSKGFNEGLKDVKTEKKAGFSSKLGFVLAAAGSAVGLGNLWRFPYLTAQYGGGVFILSYVLLAVFFGIALLMLEIGIGRKTGKSVVGAFPALNKKFGWLGYFSAIVPIIIVPYYCVIGGWLIKYVIAFLTGDSGLVSSVASSPEMTKAFFDGFVSSTFEPLLFFFIFAAATVLIVCFGVKNGIEKMSKILMPALAILAIALMIFVLCQNNSSKGLEFIFIPKLEDFSFNTILAALGQLFYSMSIGMCIMITYGSYMKKEAKITSSSTQIAIFDSAFAFIASIMIICAVFSFGSGEEALKSEGPALMFIQLTNVFNAIPLGRVIGVIFFILVLFAALTSSISLVEAIVAVICEKWKIKRVPACMIVLAIILVLGTLSSLGFGALSGFTIGGKDILSAFDFLANNILIPIVAIITCVFAGWFIEKNIITKEIGIDKNKYLSAYFNVIVKFVAPICILVILITGLFITL